MSNIEDDFDEDAIFGKKQGNPLSKYFRMPGLHVKLPTNGAFLPKGSIEFNMAGEIEVYPMRAADEILLKSPDALMSGQAIEGLLASCVPSIKTPKEISTPDLDLLLLAIRAASFGESMDMETSCPSCHKENNYSCDLSSIIATTTYIPAINPVKLSEELTVYVRPYNVQNATDISLAAFNESRSIQSIEIEFETRKTMLKSNSEELANLEKEYEIKKAAALKVSFAKMTVIDQNMTAECIISINTPEGKVTDKEDIKEFMQNIPTMWSKNISAKLKELNSAGVNKRLPITCTHCEHEWETEIEFDPSSFFGTSS